jgi:hypothetical protein
MSFLRKLFGFVVVIITLVVLQIYSKDASCLELHCFGKDFSIGIYFLVAGLLSLLFTIFFVKSFLKWLVLLFSKNKKTEEGKSIKQIAELIIASDYDFVDLFKKTTVIDKFMPIKTTLSLKRNLAIGRNIDKTDISSVDIHIMKLRLKKLIDQNELYAAIELAYKVIKKYAEYLLVVQNEILEVAQLAKKNSISFCFDPRKFKYGLPQRFIDDYFISLGMINFDIESVIEKKLRIIEKLHREYPNNLSVLQTFLDFITVNDSIKYNDKKIVDAMKETISVNPNRVLAYYLLKLNRKDGFELAQELTASVEDGNVERLWLLLIVATKMNFVTKAKELIKKIVEIDDSGDIFKFYMQNNEILSADNEILKMIIKRAK